MPNYWRSLIWSIGEAPTELPNQLTEPTQTRRVRRFGLLTLLVVFALIPRLWMATRLPSICPDAVIYFRAAQALDRGDLQLALSDVKLNTLPIVLAALHRLGLPWDTAGIAWGLTMSSLAILPLFGWVRRQFNDRTAIVACLLYALHPGLIERSPEIIREPTFWFCFLSGLYCAWRAAAEGRFSMYLATGLCLIVAVLTRFEGILLLIPLFWWSGVRLIGLRHRAGPLLGLASAVLVGPLFLFLLHLLLFPDASVGKLIRFDPLTRANVWLASWTNPHAHELAAGPILDPDHPTELRELIGDYIQVVGRGFEPIIALLLPASLIGWPRLWRRSDVIPLLLISCAVLGGTWIHLWFAEEVSSRYVLTTFLVLCPLASLGLLWPERRRNLLPRRLAMNRFAQGITAIALMIGLTAYGWIDAFSSNYANRQAEATLGRWIAQQRGAGTSFAGSPRVAALAAYYAGSELHELLPGVPHDELLQSLEALHPDVLLIDRDEPELFKCVAQHAEGWGLEAVEPACVPPGYIHHAQLFVRRPSPGVHVSRADAGHAR